MADHARPVTYEIPPSELKPGIDNNQLLYIHRAQGRKGRILDDATEQFVEATRTGPTI
jgi:hypothetical protein